MGFNIPAFFEDPQFAPIQEELQEFGSNIISGGQLPERFGAIGKFDSPQFQGLLRNLRTSTAQSISGSIAKAGLSGRGGLSQALKEKALTGTEATLRFQDFLRAQQGQQFLLGAGTNVLAGVAGRGLQSQTARNQFNLQAEIADQAQKQQKKASKSALIGQIVSGAIGAAGSFGASKILSSALGGLSRGAAGAGTDLVSSGITPQSLTSSFLNRSGGSSGFTL